MDIHCLFIGLLSYDDSRDKILHFTSLPLLENDGDKVNETYEIKKLGQNA